MTLCKYCLCLRKLRSLGGAIGRRRCDSSAADALMSLCDSSARPSAAAAKIGFARASGNLFARVRPLARSLEMKRHKRCAQIRSGESSSQESPATNDNGKPKTSASNRFSDRSARSHSKCIGRAAVCWTRTTNNNENILPFDCFAREPKLPVLSFAR